MNLHYTVTRTPISQSFPNCMPSLITQSGRAAILGVHPTSRMVGTNKTRQPGCPRSPANRFKSYHHQIFFTPSPSPRKILFLSKNVGNSIHEFDTYMYVAIGRCRIYVAVMGVGSQQNTSVQFTSFIGEHPLIGGT